MIERLELENFTGFQKLKLNFSPRINVIIGENGTGKTHLLKAAYGLCAGALLFNNCSEDNREALNDALTRKFLRLFMPLDGSVGKMHRRGSRKRGVVRARFEGDREIEATFTKGSESLSIGNGKDCAGFSKEAVFIPTKEVLSLVKGISDDNHDAKTVELIFDDGYLDLATSLMRESSGGLDELVNENPRVNRIIPKLVDLIGGRYQRRDKEFYFQPGRYQDKASSKRTRSKSAQMYQDSMTTRFVPAKGEEYSSGMTAEGFRKIGILHLLLSNGAIDPGSTGPLFWDEPESNLNPMLMKRLVQTLLELSRNNQQVILATHDYVLLKWIDLLMDKGEGDHVRYHTLYRADEKNELAVHESDDYGSISRSAISDAFAELYDEDVKRALS